jgi:hypothetical protein
MAVNSNNYLNNSTQLPIQQMKQFESAFNSYKNLHHFLIQIEGQKEIQQILSKRDYLIEDLNSQTSENLVYVSLITKSKNLCNAEGRLADAHPPIPEKKIKDQKVWKKTFCCVDKEVRFNNVEAGGVCRGMCQWFHFLYLNTQEQFSDRRKHVIAVGEQFSNGGGIATTLLQSLALDKGKLLDLNFGTQNPHSKRRCAVPYIQFTFKELTDKSCLDSIDTKLNDLPAGSYHISLPRHVQAMVKIDDHLTFFFEPSRGVYAIQEAAPMQGIYYLIRKCPHTENDIVKIIPVTLRGLPCKKRKIPDILPVEQNLKKRKLENPKTNIT